MRALPVAIGSTGCSLTTHARRPGPPQSDSRSSSTLALTSAYAGTATAFASSAKYRPAPLTLPTWRKPVVLALWGVAAAGIALAVPSAVLDVGREAYRLLAAQPVSLSGIAGAVVAMFALTSAAAAYTLRASD